MKVLCVIDSLGSGGAQRQFVNIAKGLAANHDVEVLLYNPGSEFYKRDLGSEIPVHLVERPANSNGFRIDVLLAIIRHGRTSDVVFSFLPTANIYCAIASRFKAKFKHVSCEMSVTNETESKLRRSAANVANRLADHVICNSKCQAEYVDGQLGEKSKVSVVWNGCENLPYVERNFDRDSQIGFLVVARVAYPKNGLRLLQALSVFEKRNGYVPRVSWAGRDDNDMRAKKMKADMLSFLEHHPKIKANFSWLGEVSDVQALYSDTDALLSVSIYEGVPVVICEAMLAGCPVVASDISDNAIILANGERGFLCDPYSPEDICAAMESRLQASPKELSAMTARSRAYAEKNFSINNMIEGYQMVIDQLNK